MSATDELRHLLDDRGMEWFESVTRKGLTWIYRDGKAIRFHPWQPDTLKVSMFDITPAQAIAATLGSFNCTNDERTNGTCHKVLDFDGTAWICSECGEHIGPRRWNFCPNCGAKVVDE